MKYLKNPHYKLKHIIVIPLVSVLLIPLLIIDIFVELYHRVCFPLCRVPLVRRKDYIKIIDRGKLKYLTFWQKLYCMYCGYGNGLIHYLGEIARRTEAYWCGVKHDRKGDFVSPKNHSDFSEYGDEKDFKRKYYE